MLDTTPCVYTLYTNIQNIDPKAFSVASQLKAITAVITLFLYCIALQDVRISHTRPTCSRPESCSNLSSVTVSVASEPSVIPRPPEVGGCGTLNNLTLHSLAALVHVP